MKEGSGRVQVSVERIATVSEESDAGAEEMSVMRIDGCAYARGRL
jgi:hypothetical protein